MIEPCNCSPPDERQVRTVRKTIFLRTLGMSPLAFIVGLADKWRCFFGVVCHGMLPCFGIFGGATMGQATPQCPGCLTAA